MRSLHVVYISEMSMSMSCPRVIGYFELVSPLSSRGRNKAGKAWNFIFDIEKLKTVL